MPWCNCDNNDDLHNIEVDQYTKDIRCSLCQSKRSDIDVLILLLHEVGDIQNTLSSLIYEVNELKREKEEREEKEHDEFMEKIKKENEEMSAMENIKKGTERFNIMDL